MKNIKEPVRLREKPLKNGAKSLYLDIYQDGVRTYEYLKLYLNPGSDPITKAKNKATLEAARVIQAKRLVEVQTRTAAIISGADRRIKFVDYYQDYYAHQSSASEKYRENSKYALRRWIDYAGSELPISKVTAELLAGYVKFLKNEHNFYRKKQVHIHPGNGREESYISMEEAEKLIWKLVTEDKLSFYKIEINYGILAKIASDIYKRMLEGKEIPKISEQTIAVFFRYISTVVNRAAKKKLIPHNPIHEMEVNEKPHAESDERVILTLDEVKKLAATPCRHESIKQMFLFSCFTGLRSGDMKKLVWANIDDSMLTKIQNKTQKAVYIPLSENAMQWLPKRGKAKASSPVFTGYPSKNAITEAVHEWCAAAGIEKHVTFHVARHTFATLELSYGVDIYTVSNLLGHRSITTTQIYTRVIDKKKIDAVNMIPKI